MPREPRYPRDAAVGDSAAAGGDEGKPRDGSNRTKHLMTGAAIGIGSAAIVAALLYAKRGRRNDG